MNLGGGKGISIRELAETLQKAVPFRFEFDAAKPSGFPKRVMDITLARQKLGYEPAVSLEQGLKKTWEWFSSHRSEHLLKKNYFTHGSGRA